MRKLSLILTLGAALIIVTPGCLKDKKFEDQEYGIQENLIKAVSLSESRNSPILKGLNAVATPQQIITAVKIEGDNKPAPQDVHVKLQLDPALATAMGYTAVPVTAFNVTLDVVIPAGKYLADVIITIPNASILDPNQTYGIGLRVINVDGGYIIPANLKELVVAFSLKNAWDGQYQVLKSQVNDPNRPTISNSTFGVNGALAIDMTVEIITTGANSNIMSWIDFAPPIPGHAAPTTGGSWTYFGNAQPKYVWDGGTNNLTGVENQLFGPPQNRTFQVIRGNRNSTTKIIVAEYNMLQSGFMPVYHYDSLLYIGPR